MARNVYLAAGVFSLIFVSLPENAQAESTTASSADINSASITLFGKTLCSARAPLVAKCDWRLPDIEMTRAEGSDSYSFTFLGQRYCVGAEIQDQCDVRLPLESEPERRSSVMTLFGINLCFGDVSPVINCHMRLMESPKHDEWRASL